MILRRTTLTFRALTPRLWEPMPRLSRAPVNRALRAAPRRAAPTLSVATRRAASAMLRTTRRATLLT
eukprot:1880359-Lingulodinium_polyedra.AAC.1